MVEAKTFSLSANGDSWSLETDASTGEAVVLHKANASSGGHETRRSIEHFLTVSAGKPEHDSLLQILGRAEREDPANAGEADVPTPSYITAMRYLELGGNRLASADDNVVSTRLQDIDPMDAEAFWQANVEGLAENKKREVVLHLPSTSDVDTNAGQEPRSRTGFTMSLFIGLLAFNDPAALDHVKIGLLLGSVASDTLGAILLLMSGRRTKGLLKSAGQAER